MKIMIAPRYLIVRLLTTVVFVCPLQIHPQSSVSDDNLEQPNTAIQKAQNSVVSIQTHSKNGSKESTKVGSGFFYERHYIITRRSVVDGADSIAITLTDGRRGIARLVYCDHCTEVAVLEHSLDDVSPVSMGDSQRLPIGSPVTILGNSLGIFPSVTLGRLSKQRHDGYLEFDGIIPPGNCGGPIFDASGNLMGMMVGRMREKENASRIAGIALSSKILRTMLDRLPKESNAKTGWIGLSVVDLQDDRESAGVRVVDVVSEGPADRASISKGDTIVRFQGNPIRNADELAEQIKRSSPNSKVSLGLRSGNREWSSSIRVGFQQENRP
jgi:S1-C subfamily serine protease